jgi:rhodanese-related sulfurtransferase
MASKRINAHEAHDRLVADGSLLVCAYDSDEKFQQNHLRGAMPLSEFRSQADSLPKNQEIIFYCA